MYQIEFNNESNKRGLANTAIIREMLDGLTAESIERSYNAGVNRDVRYHFTEEKCLYVFLGLLHALAMVYIFDQSDLDKKSPEYISLVTKLAELVGHSNGRYCLSFEEYEKAIKMGLLPVNAETINGPLEDVRKPLQFIDTALFMEAVSVVFGFVAGEVYDPVQLKSTGDINKDVLLKLEKYCHDTYAERLSFERFMSRPRQPAVSGTGQVGKSLNIDL